jgi:DNA-binding NarL/FixJ family response regulator
VSSADGNPPAILVALAHGDELVRAGWRGLLDGECDIVVVGEASNAREATALVREIRTDVVFMDLRLPGSGGVEATREIVVHPELSEVEVLMLGEDEREEDLLAALRAGANGFLTIDAEPEELLRAVRALARGGMHLSPRVTRRLVDKFVRQPAQQGSATERLKRLSVREREVVALVALGLNNREIAEQLAVSPATVKTHVTRSMVKLHAPDRAKLIALAYETGFAHPSEDGAQPLLPQ